MSERICLRRECNETFRRFFSDGKTSLEHRLMQLKEEFPTSADKRDFCSISPPLSLSQFFFFARTHYPSPYRSVQSGKYICRPLNDRISNQQKSHRTRGVLSVTTPRYSGRSFFVSGAFDLRTIKVFRAKSVQRRQQREDSDSERTQRGMKTEVGKS